MVDKGKPGNGGAGGPRPEDGVEEDGPMTILAETAEDWAQAIEEWDHSLHLGELPEPRPQSRSPRRQAPSGMPPASASSPAAASPSLATPSLATPAIKAAGEPAGELEIDLFAGDEPEALPPPPPKATDPAPLPSQISPITDEDLLASLPVSEPVAAEDEVSLPLRARSRRPTPVELPASRETSRLLPQEDEFYDTISIEQQETRSGLPPGVGVGRAAPSAMTRTVAGPVPAAPASKAPAEQVEFLDLGPAQASAPEEDLILAESGLTPLAHELQRHLEGLGPTSRILLGGRGRDEDLTPVPEDVDAEPVPSAPQVVHTITLEAELPPPSTRTPASSLSPRPSASSMPPPDVLVELARSTLTPPPSALTGDLRPRRLALPTLPAFSDPAAVRAPARRPAAQDRAAREAELDLLRAELAAQDPLAPPARRALLIVAIAALLESLGADEQAQERYRQALQAEPTCRPALRGLRRALSRPGPAADGRLIEAAALLEREIALCGPQERQGLLLQRGELLLRIGQTAAARAAFQTALGEKGPGPGVGQIHALCGLCDVAVKEDADAGAGAGAPGLAAALDGLLRLPELALPPHQALWAAMQIERGRQLEFTGQDEAAALRYQAALSVSPRARVPAGLGLLRTALARGDAGPGRKAAATMAEGLSEGALRASLLRFSAGPEPKAEPGPGQGPGTGEADGQRAARVAALTIAAAGGDRLALEDLAAAQAGDPVAAALTLTRLASGISDPARRADVLTQAGVACEQAWDLDGARRLLSMALQAAEWDAVAARISERIDRRLGHPRALLDLARREPGPFAHLSAARLLLQQAGQTADLTAAAEAEGELRAALSLRPDYGPAVDLLRDLLCQSGRAGEAAEVLLQAAALTGEAPGDRALARLYREDAARLLLLSGRAEAGARLLLDDLRAEVPPGITRWALRWQHQRLLGAGGRTELVPETEPELAGQLAEALRAEAEETSDRQRAADLWFRRALLLWPTDPLVTPAGGPVEESLSRAFGAEPGHGPALVALLSRALGGELEGSLGARRRESRSVRMVLEQLRGRLSALTSGSNRGGPAPEVVILLLRLAAAQEHEASSPRGALLTLGLLRSLVPDAAFFRGLVGEGMLRLSRRAGDPAILIEMLEDAAAREEDPELRFALLLQLAERLLQEGRPAPAIERIEAALHLRPGHPVAMDALRRAYQAAGQRDRLRALALEELAEATDFSGRAAAQERLAVLAAQEPGGEAEALAAYRELLRIDAGHHVAMRFLERHFLAKGDVPELIHLYEQQGLVATDPAYAVYVHLDRARLRQRLAWQRERDGYEGLDGAESLDELMNALENDFRLALYRDRHSRPALRYVLAAALRTHDLLQVADLSTRLAEICDLSGSGRGEAGDGRAAAVFLTRAAECYTALHASAEAVSLAYRAALERNPMHVPALRGFLQHALVQQMWAEAAEMAEGCGAALHNVDERYQAYLLAGAIAQEQLKDPARAQAAYREALRVDPTRSDAFERLRVLLSGHGGAQADPHGLSELLGEQLQIEGDPERQVALRLELAGLLTGALGNRARAKIELRQALAYAPHDLGVLARLSDLHYEDGEWAEAADLLLRRARVERRPEELAEIFVRLGQIYSEHLPDLRRAVAAYGRTLELVPDHVPALSQLSALYLAHERPDLAVPLLGRLAELSADREQKVAYLHRVGRLYEGMGEVRLARDAFLQAVDLDPMYLPAVGALAHFFDRQSDVQSMRVHLDRSAARFRQHLRERPDDVTVYQALFQIAQWRRSMDQALMIAGVLHCLGGPVVLTPEAAAVLERDRGQDRYPGPALRDPALDEALFPASVPPGLRNLFHLLHEPLHKHYRTEWRQVEALGVQRREKLPRSGHPLRDLANRIATDMNLGTGEFDIYVTQAQGRDEDGRQAPLCTLALTEPVSLLIGQQLVSGATEGELRFFLGRLLKLVQSRLVLPLLLPAEELGVLVAGLVRQFVKDYAPIGIAERRIANEAQKLQRLIPRKLEAQLLPFAMECASAGLDLEEVAGQLWVCANHAGLLIAGSVLPAHAALLRLGPLAEAQVQDLLRFAIGEECAELRRILGTGGG